jgi:hypothetical protein
MANTSTTAFGNNFLTCTGYVHLTSSPVGVFIAVIESPTNSIVSVVLAGNGGAVLPLPPLAVLLFVC